MSTTYQERFRLQILLAGKACGMLRDLVVKETLDNMRATAEEIARFESRHEPGGHYRDQSPKRS